MISLSVVISSVAISFLVALFWLIIIDQKTGFLKWKNNNLFGLAIGSITAVGIAGLLEFILLEDRYLSGSVFLGFNSFLDNSLLFYLTIAALIEEFFKGIVAWWGIKKIKIRSAKDGVIIGMIVGLFFAVAENGIYFAPQISFSSELREIFNLVVLRIIFSITAHMIFSGIAGFFVAKSLNSAKLINKSFLISGGLLVAVLIHTIFNVSATFSYLTSIMVIVVGLFFMAFLLRDNYK